MAVALRDISIIRRYRNCLLESVKRDSVRVNQ